ncbi:ankyrin repeat domain-containing protein 45 isoform X1 [Labrus bergylta]|uniref:ankyrin repeat domain-containing protein 45 isoform X1 n=2 Tax=Labrus bergylta TaxID=56723 RepID=UPI003314457B
MTSLQQDIFNCVLSGDLKTIKELFEGEGVTEEEVPEDGLFGMKDEAGRNALLTASMLGRSAIVPELLRHEALVNEQTVRGYSSLHLAACWGHLETVRTLLELGADTQAKTFRGERPLDLAHRYSKTDCADCLILADAQQDFLSYVTFIKDMTSDSKRNLTKEEKKICKSVCSSKSDWIQSVRNPTVSDFLDQRQDIEDTLRPILTKLTAGSAEVPGKTAGKD